MTEMWLKFNKPVLKMSHGNLGSAGMAKNLPQSISDVLKANKNRPFDSSIKQTLKEPGVLRLLWKQYCEAEAVEAFPQTRQDLSFSTDNVTWLDKEFRNSQATWTADLIARVGRNAIVHVEQQTNHNATVAGRRLMLYASQIATHFNFKKSVFQLYYYTGDAKMNWDFGQNAGGVVLNARSAISNKFLVVDSGLHDAETMMESQNFDYALLGLLAREIGDPEKHVRKLLELARKQFSGAALHHKLVHCITIASLRHRGELVWSEVTKIEMNNIVIDPFWKKFERLRDRDRKKLGSEIFRAFQSLKELFGNDLPDDILEFAFDHFEWHDLEILEANKLTAERGADIFVGTALDPKNRAIQGPKPKLGSGRLFG